MPRAPANRNPCVRHTHAHISEKCKIIAIANQKGGVGKTTTCANLGVGLAQEGKRVLLIDSDPQGSLSISLGFTEPDKLPYTLSTAMMQAIEDQLITVTEGILHHEEKVDLLPANIELAGLEVSLINAMSRERILKQCLEPLNHHLKNPQLTLKAKGLLSMMLSFPDEWNYSERGLAAICKEGVDAIHSAIKELEKAGYMERHQIRGKGGKIVDRQPCQCKNFHSPSCRV